MNGFPTFIVRLKSSFSGVRLRQQLFLRPGLLVSEWIRNHLRNETFVLSTEWYTNLNSLQCVR